MEFTLFKMYTPEMAMLLALHHDGYVAVENNDANSPLFALAETFSSLIPAYFLDSDMKGAVHLLSYQLGSVG